MTELEMTSCDQCLAEIPAAAKKCRHCGSSQGPSVVDGIRPMVGVFLLGLLLLAIGLANEGEAADVVRAIGGLTAIISGVTIVGALLKRD